MTNQEENKILDKTNRQKVLEVEKLSRTIAELEETILAGGAAANAIRDYRRQISELNVGFSANLLNVTVAISRSIRRLVLKRMINLLCPLSIKLVGGEEDSRERAS